LARDTPEVSIGVPVYNGERFLAEALDALLAQTHENLEIIVCDNASSDGTQAIATEYARRDPRVRYHRNETNIGAAGNFNRCFELARAPFFKWQSADDLCDPPLVERCLATLKENPDAIVAYARTRLVDEHGALLREYEDRMDQRSPDPVQRFRGVLDSLGLCNVQYGVARSNLMRRTQLMGPYVASDVVMIAEMSLHGTICEVPDRLFARRYHAEASSAITTDAGIATFWDPRSRRRLRRRWSHFRGYWRAVTRARLPLRDTLRLSALLMRRMAWARAELWRELMPAH
jgi:glycosyltransferase involved in cell wall biosynthesis